MYGEDFKLRHHHDEQKQPIIIDPRTRKRFLQDYLIRHKHPSRKHKIFSKSQVIFMDLSLATTSSDQEQDQDQETTAGIGTISSGNNVNNLLVPIEKEHMFDKVVTPSDVGKLNRLVIPKQHAEKYFPLDSSSNQSGTLLNFQDRNGKMWRFRYSYWNSSQSYVMTKGWSRFVKEKKLDAGDIVSFQRGVGESGKSRLFIDWRHRPDINLVQNPTSSSSSSVLLHQLGNNFNFGFNFPTPVHSGRLHNVYPPEYSVPVSRSLNFGVRSYHQHQYYRQEREIIGYGYGSIVGSCCYARSPLDQQNSVGSEPLVIDSVPVVPGRITPAVVAPPLAGKRLRLFGVNMDCGTDDNSSAVDESCAPDDVSRREMGASSSSASALQLSLSSDGDQFAKKGKSSLSFDLDP